MKQILIFSIIIILSSCATNLKITYQSNPPGADIYEDNTIMGKAPLVIEYKVTEEMKKLGSVRTKPITAIWISGAKSTLTEGLEININKGSNWNYTFQRPQNYPNFQMDVTYGQNHERNMILKEQQHIQQQQLYLQNLQYQEEMKRNQQKKPKSCYSDFQCGMGSKCAKKEHEYQGICVDIYYYNE